MPDCAGKRSGKMNQSSRVMKVLRANDDLATLPEPSHLAIGVFDGLHLGHQAVIGRALESSRETGGSAVVVTFDPHPVRVLRPEKALEASDLHATQSKTDREAGG